VGKVVRSSSKLTSEEVKAAIAFEQPKLRAVRDGPNIHIGGNYLLFENGAVANPAGPISEFNIKIVLSDRFPRQEPKIFEVGGRIPRSADRHVNPDGDCCVTVWEHWLACAGDHSFAAFLNGPVTEFFLGQYWFEKTGKWPFGERPHGPDGLEEAYAEALGIPNRKKDIIYHLRLLSKDWPKGHWLCPCGSGKLLRHCHRYEMMALHERIPPRIARRMLRRLKSEAR
jgi:hypothetical protein